MAAVLVYLFHIGFYSGARLPGIGNLGSEAVLVFFVLSGFVIAYSTNRKHTDIQDFTIARLARLWSVVLPALALTILLDTCGQSMNLSAYEPLQPYSFFKWLASSIINVLFLGQIWNLKISPGTNGPFWSISYEFWFYALFAVSLYYRGWLRLVLCAICMIVAGPKIIMAFPLWYIGVLTYRKLSQLSDPQIIKGWLLWIGSILIGVCYFLLEGPKFLENYFPYLFDISKTQWRVNFMPESLFLAMLVAVNIYGFGVASHKISPVSISTASRIRLAADTSFGLYLFHYPLILFFKAFLAPFKNHSDVGYILLMYSMPFFLSIALALICERNKGYFKCLLESVRGK